MAPKVLVSDKLSDTAVQIFRDRGVDVTFQPDLGKDKDALLAAIPEYDGLAIRSATKVTAKLLDAASNLKIIARGGHWRRQCRYPGRLEEGRDRDEHAVRQLDHHRRTCDRDDVRGRTADPRGRYQHASRQVGKEPLHGGRADRPRRLA